jgi:hypothetical protein
MSFPTGAHVFLFFQQLSCSTKRKKAATSHIWRPVTAWAKCVNKTGRLCLRVCEISANKSAGAAQMAKIKGHAWRARDLSTKGKHDDEATCAAASSHGYYAS